MLYKLNFNLILTVFGVGILLFISNGYVAAQPTLKEPNRKKDFGRSLQKYEKKEKDSSKDKKNSQENPKQSKVSDEETIRVETNLVSNDVLVVNGKGNAILGLKKSDFIITEDGVEQKTELFTFGENSQLPRSIVLILRTVGPTKYSWVKNNIEAAKVLVDKLAPQDRMAIAITEQKLILDFTKDKALLKKAIDRLASNPDAESRIFREYGTLMTVLNEMFDEEDIRPIVIVQSGDGELNLLKGEFAKLSNSAQGQWLKNKRLYKKAGGERGYSFGDVLESVEKSRATIYSIIPYMRFVGLPREEQLRRARIRIEEMWRVSLQIEDPKSISQAVNQHQEDQVDYVVRLQTAWMQVAKLSGGYTEFVEKPEEAQKAFETIFKVINNRYTIGYYPSNEAKDGKRRNVKIAVRNHPEYTIVGRKTYMP